MGFDERRAFQFSRNREMNCEREWEGEKEKRKGFLRKGSCVLLVWEKRESKKMGGRLEKRAPIIFGRGKRKCENYRGKM
jgi:hypothetical protein